MERERALKTFPLKSSITPPGRNLWEGGGRAKGMSEILSVETSALQGTSQRDNMVTQGASRRAWTCSMRRRTPRMQVYNFTPGGAGADLFQMQISKHAVAPDPKLSPRKGVSVLTIAVWEPPLVSYLRLPKGFKTKLSPEFVISEA